MANLIIKSSANDLVIQGSDESPAITVGATGTTTFAENATLSGTANALGTVTSGNLANTAIVYPAGHVVQTTTSTYAATRSTVTSANGTYQATVVTGQITPQYDDSSIIVHATFGVDIHDETSSDCGYAMRWHKSGTGATTGYPAEMSMTPHATQSHSNFYRNAYQYVTLVDYYSISLMNNNCETTNTLTYTLHVSGYGIDGDLFVGTNNWYNTNWMIYLQEIKR